LHIQSLQQLEVGHMALWSRSSGQESVPSWQIQFFQQELYFAASDIQEISQKITGSWIDFIA